MAAASGKCFLVTGPPGVGKSTLIISAFESLKASNPSLKLQGFFTREIRQGSERVGFEVVTLDGRKAPLASTTISRSSFSSSKSKLGKTLKAKTIKSPAQSPILSIFARVLRRKQSAKLNAFGYGSPKSFRWPTVGKYKVDIASFESLALPELQVREDTDLFVIDEVGKMELYSSFFFPAVLKILESNIPVLASVPVPKSGRDIPAVARLKNHPGATIFTLNESNRDSVKEQVYSQIVDLLAKR